MNGSGEGGGYGGGSGGEGGKPMEGAVKLPCPHLPTSTSQPQRHLHCHTHSLLQLHSRRIRRFLRLLCHGASIIPKISRANVCLGAQRKFGKLAVLRGTALFFHSSERTLGAHAFLQCPETCFLAVPRDILQVGPVGPRRVFGLCLHTLGKNVGLARVGSN